MGFTQYWDYEPTNAIHDNSISPGVCVYTGDKVLNINTKNKVHLKCVVFDGFFVNGIRQPILFRFNLDKTSGYEVICEP